MGDHQTEEKSAVESVLGNISEIIHQNSSPDSGDGKNVLGSDLKNKVYRLFGRERPVHKLLGGGKSADIFLWRDKKSSAGLLGIVTAIWVLFAVVEYNLLTLTCHILILALALLFLWSNASIFITKTPAHIPTVALPEKPVLEFASALTVEINHGLALLRDIASGKDIKMFLALIFGLWIVSVLGSCYSFVTLAFLTFGFVHTIPALYEKYDDKVDAFAEKALAEIKKQYAVFDVKVLSKIPRGVAKNKKMA